MAKGTTLGNENSHCIGIELVTNEEHGYLEIFYQSFPDMLLRHKVERELVAKEDLDRANEFWEQIKQELE